MSVSYLDVDDEITTAVARLRARATQVVLVLPPGSRSRTRINFLLLAREAQELPRQASIVTPEDGVRAIAVSAGLPAYASVAEYEAAADAAAGAGVAVTAPIPPISDTAHASRYAARRPCPSARGRRGSSRGCRRQRREASTLDQRSSRL